MRPSQRQDVTDARLRKLRFRAWRRGIREADLILGGFADARLGEFSAEELDQFEALLEQPDPELYAWILGREAPPQLHDTALLAAIRAFRLDEPARVQGA